MGTERLDLELPQGQIRRQRLLQRLDDATSAGRLTVLVGGAGFGKTTLLRQWFAAGTAAWHSVVPADRDPGTLTKHLVDALRLNVPEMSTGTMLAASPLRGYSSEETAGAVAVAAALAEALDSVLRRPMVLVIDDLHEIADTEGSAALVDALIRHAPTLLSIVIASRDQPPFPTARLVAHGDATEVDAAELAFTAAETAELVESVVGDAAPDLAERVHELSSGWPVATRLVVAAMTAGPADAQLNLPAFAEPRGLLLRYMADEVIGHENDDVLAFLDCAQALDSIDADLVKVAEIADSDTLLARLVRQGVYVEPAPKAPGRVRLRPLFRSYLVRHRPLPDTRRRDLMKVAVRWHADQGEPAAALGYALRLGDADLCLELLHESGATLAATGHARLVLDAAAQVSVGTRDASIDVLAGDAALMLGSWDDALGHFTHAAAATGPTRAAVAWRLGLLHYLRGELNQAVQVFQAADSTDPDLAARALLLGWWASAQWLRGNHDRCRELVQSAYLAASAASDDKALACVHTVYGMLAAFDGDRPANDAHYLRALDHATAASDVLQLVRIHANRSSQRLEEGDAPGALDEVEIALRLADLAGLATFRALAMSNRGEALVALGRLDEARAELAAARAMFETLGSSMAAYPGAALGDVHMVRGDRVSARACYDRAIELAESVGDVQGLVPALVGMAELSLIDDPHRARELADRALSAGTSLRRVRALLASARIHAATGDKAAACEDVRAAAAGAEGQRDRAGLAEASEVLAQVTDDRMAAMAAVEQWEALGDPVRMVRARLVLARLEPRHVGVELAEQVERDARRVGARSIALAAHAWLNEVLQATDPHEVRVNCLGGLVVSRAGEVAPWSAWQSRKARDVLKVLVCRGGRPIHREELLELLWPGDDPAKTANRLSVALSTVRTVLDPDHRHPPDHYVLTDGDAVALRHVVIDIERFLHGAARGLALVRTDPRQARAVLEAAELIYAGDLFEEDPYAEWAVDLREKARLRYVDVARALAKLAAADGDGDARSRYLLRILERDPYDESAHLDLVRLLAAQGRYGEARRRYRLYARRLAEIDVEAAAYPVSGRGSAAR